MGGGGDLWSNPLQLDNGGALTLTDKMSHTKLLFHNYYYFIFT